MTIPSHIDEALKLLDFMGGNISATATQIGMDRGTLRKWRDRYHVPVREEVIPEPAQEAIPDPVREYKERIKFEPVAEEPFVPKVFLITSAQNNTKVHENFWRNWEAYAAYRDAQIITGNFIYRKDAWGQRAQEVKGKTKNEKGPEWDARVEKYAINATKELAPGLQWRGEMNVLPTAGDPLSGLLSYSGQDSMIMPHAKVALQAVPTAPGQPSKLVYTTGACTEPNYIQRKAGLKAEFHHVIGGLIVELDGDDWFVRQIIADKDGNFQDLDVSVTNGFAVEGKAILSIQWGDIHVAKLDKDMIETCWGENGILDQLRPKHQFLHDLFDMEARNHHDSKSPRKNFEKHVAGKDNVYAEVQQAAEFVRTSYRHWCESVVVCSNHDNALSRWLDDVDGRHDSANALFWLKANLASYTSVAEGDVNFNPLRWAFNLLGCPTARYLTENDSFKVAGIECALHGHLFANGVKGSPKAFTRLGTKVNIGHFHQPTIVDGVYVAGVQAALYHGYNKGFSGWSHSMILTYPNGKRTIVTMRGLKYRAS